MTPISQPCSNFLLYSDCSDISLVDEDININNNEIKLNIKSCNKPKILNNERISEMRQVGVLGQLRKASQFIGTKNEDF